MKMQLHWSINRLLLIMSSLCLALCVLSGCAVVGPKSISMGRAGYNEAINRTEDEQLLLSIVKGRYGETFSLLAVNGVAANVRFSTNAGIEIGFGSDADYAGNLVPFSGGVMYEENPTITYSPVQGEQYLRQLLSPIPLDILVLLVQAEMDSANAIVMLAKKINTMRNPRFLVAPSTDPERRFQRFAELNEEMYRAGVVRWVADPKEKDSFRVLINGYAPTHSEQVREYLSLLELPMPVEKSDDIILPVYFGVQGRKSKGIVISTRSTADLIRILKAAVEVPQEHARAGLTLSYPTPGLAGEHIQIHASKDKPASAAIAVRYREYWFYIDETDMHTKMFYQMARILWSLSISAVADLRAAPLLTIPVSD